jgi:hypothetical protein
MPSEAQTAAFIRRPRVLADALHQLAELMEQTANEPIIRRTRFASHTLPSIAFHAATTVGPEEFTDACRTASADDIDAAMAEHEEIYGKLLPWDGSIIKQILANLPAILEAIKILIALLAKTA